MYHDKLPRQIAQHNANNRVQIRNLLLKAIKYHISINVKIMIDNDIPHLFNIFPVYCQIFKE